MEDGLGFLLFRAAPHDPARLADELRGAALLNLSMKKPGANSAPGQMALTLCQALFSGEQQRIPKHLAILYARENNIRIIILFFAMV